jgi:hypothetical protein
MRAQKITAQALVELLARIVAAREELENGAMDQATAILGDLEADLAELVERSV